MENKNVVIGNQIIEGSFIFRKNAFLITRIKNAPKLPVKIRLATKLAIELQPGLDPSERRFKLLVTRILVYAKFIETQQFATYSFLMGEMRIHYVDLINRLKALAVEDVGNGDATTDSLVANDGDDVPPKGHFNCGVEGRNELLTLEDCILYHDRMMDRHCVEFNIKLKAVPTTFYLPNRLPQKYTKLERYVKANPDALLTYSDKRFYEFNGVIRKAA